MDTVANSIQDVIMKLDDVDGVYFTLNEDETAWKFTALTLTKGETFHEYETGTKYKIMLHGEGNKIFAFEAILGSPTEYVKNLVQSKQEGMILKKCSRAEVIFEEFSKNFDFEYVK